MTLELAPATPLGDPIERIPLIRAPIVRVVSQVRFPPILSISNEEFIAPFQERVRKRYPGYAREIQQNIMLNDGGALNSKPSVVYRFTDAEGTSQISLAQNFLALHQQVYENREDFTDRLSEIMRIASEEFEPQVYDRFGVRYTDVVEGEDLEKLEELIRPQLLDGLALRDLAPGIVEQALSEVEVESDGDFLKARWGLLPAGVAIDQSLQALDDPSWVIDLDAFVRGPAPIDLGDLNESAWRLSDKVYRFFRWSVQDQFLAHYGAA